MSEKHSQKTRKTNTSMITDFGIRKISNQNFSKIIAIPKQALENCQPNADRVNIKLVQESKERYLKLTPIKQEVSS